MIRFDKSKYEYGDWQTNQNLSLSVCKLLKSKNFTPQIIIEPTCGAGNFILSALNVFDNVEKIYGIEIHKPYIEQLENRLSKLKYKTEIELIHNDFFFFDFSQIKQFLKGKRILVIGNPPWVTNSVLGEMGGKNLPKKSNFKHENGLSAITGKANFDIAENISLQLIDLLQGENAVFAFLVKNSVIKNLVYQQENCKFGISEINQYIIDAKKEFDVSVSASLLTLRFSSPFSNKCNIFDFYTLQKQKEYGWVNGNFVSDSNTYRSVMFMDGKCQFEWRSGIKHDCSKVIELTLENNILKNGLNEIVDIESDCIYPLFKGSDIVRERENKNRKFIVLTQKHTSDDTSKLGNTHPKMYQYLLKHAKYLDGRKSSIYKKRSRFCLFGIGDYSFKPYKVAISGLHKNTKFKLIQQINGKAPMLDDTCYMIGFDCYEDANIVQRVLNSPFVQLFIESLFFKDAKRPITKDILMRIDFKKLLDNKKAKDLNITKEQYARLYQIIK